MKTNKSLTKRFKVTRKGKVMARKPGQNHFNAKESRRARLAKKRPIPFPMGEKAKKMFGI